MSEILRIRNPKMEKLKSLILRLHQGEDRDVVKKEFVSEFKYVSGGEIAEMEKQLIEEGMSIEDIMNLCDIHASLFQDNIEDLHNDKKENEVIDILRAENAKISEYITSEIKMLFEKESHAITKEEIIDQLKLLDMIKEHYNKKEQFIFPLLECANVY